MTVFCNVHLSTANVTFRVEPAGGGSGKQKVVDVRQKTFMLIYPDPIVTNAKAYNTKILFTITINFTE
jgi:hypothetical protein